MKPTRKDHKDNIPKGPHKLHAPTDNWTLEDYDRHIKSSVLSRCYEPRLLLQFNLFGLLIEVWK